MSRDADGDRTNAMRALDARGVPYDVVAFAPDVRSAVGVAESAHVPAREVFKTLVVVRPKGRPLLVMAPGDRSVDLKRLARSVGEKRLSMASHAEAESLTGLQTGGISALALLGRPFDVVIDAAARELPHVLVSAGRRGVNLRLAVSDLVDVTGATWVEASEA